MFIVLYEVNMMHKAHFVLKSDSFIVLVINFAQVRDTLEVVDYCGVVDGFHLTLASDVKSCEWLAPN